MNFQKGARMKKALKPLDLKDAVESMEKEMAAGRPLSEVGNECKDLINDWEAAFVDDSDEPISIDDAAALLGVTKQTLRNWEKENKLVPARTAGNHRRYLRSQINALRKKQMNTDDILIHDIPVAKVRDMIDKLLANFDVADIVHITVKRDYIEKKVVIMVENIDGNSSISRTLKMED